MFIHVDVREFHILCIVRWTKHRLGQTASWDAKCQLNLGVSLSKTHAISFLIAEASYWNLASYWNVLCNILSFCFQFTFLDGPHGNCGSKPLRHFPKIPYNFQLCLIECDLNFALDKCGCVPMRWAYLFEDDDDTGKNLIKYYYCLNSIQLNLIIQSGFSAGGVFDKGTDDCLKYHTVDPVKYTVRLLFVLFSFS